MNGILQSITHSKPDEKFLAVLIDPDKFDSESTEEFLMRIPMETTHIFIGGSIVANGMTQKVVTAVKKFSRLPVIIFPGNVSQISPMADGLLFLSLISGNNPEFLIGQQVKAVPILRNMSIEIIPTGYILINGGNGSDVEKITQTSPICRDHVQLIIDTAVAGQYLGKKLIYLEAGSGARYPVSPEVISAVKQAIEIPLVVGGGINTHKKLKAVYNAGADMAVIGNALEAGDVLPEVLRADHWEKPAEL